VPGSPAFARRAEVQAIALAEMAQIAGGGRLLRPLLEAALSLPAAALARHLVALDGDLARGSLRSAALATLRRYGVGVAVDYGQGGEPPRHPPRHGFGLAGAHPNDGGEGVPRRGPVLLVANHPGLFDALALFAAIGRDDLVTLAARRPLLDALPNVRRRLLTIDPGPFGGIALRRAVRHLRGGGALLHFPAGQIEPDPRVAPRGTPLLLPWKPGLGVLIAAAARACPGLLVASALVSGVISPRALAAARALRRGRTDDLTDALVPLLQLTFPGFGDVDVQVRFGPFEPPLPDGAGRLRARLEEMAGSAATGGWQAFGSAPTFSGGP
jgi:hypothetical protein